MKYQNVHNFSAITNFCYLHSIKRNPCVALPKVFPIIIYMEIIDFILVFLNSKEFMLLSTNHNS